LTDRFDDQAATFSHINTQDELRAFETRDLPSA